MMKVQASTTIRRDLAQVFAFVSNLENNPKWETNFVQVKQETPGPIGVGSRFRCTLKFPGQRVESNMVITEYELNRKLSFAGDQPASAKPKGSILFESIPEGTRVTAVPQPEMGGIFKLLEPLMAGYIKRSSEEHLLNLKKLLEAVS